MCEIANKIKSRRIELGLTLEDVAKAVGVGRSTVQRWESGMIKNMGRDKIAALAAVLQLNPVDLVPFTQPGLRAEVISDELGRKLRKMDSITAESEGMIREDDWIRLEALHQNPKLRLLFDIQKNLDDSDLNAVLGVVNAIAKERGDDD